jgi:hypothetical protein
MLERERTAMVPPALKRVAAVAVVAIVLLLAAAPRVAADNTVQGKLAPSPNPATPSAELWDFSGPGDGSTVTLTLTYTPNGSGVDAPTGRSFDQLIGFNVYGEDGQLFGHSTLTSPGTATWSFQSTSVHQYSVQVFNYAESSPVSYTLAAQHATLAVQPTPTPTPNFLVPPTAPTPAVTPAAVSTAAPPAVSTPAVAQMPPSAAPPAAASPSLQPGASVQPGVLAKAGDQVHGHLVGTLAGATQEYRVTPTANGSSITLTLSAAQGTLIEDVEATINVYQMEGGVKVLIAVGLPEINNPTVASLTFAGGANGYGDYLADVTNSAPGQPLDYTITRS